MSRAKPRPFQTPRIVQADERRSGWLWVLMLLAIGLWTWQVFEFGQRYPDIGARAYAFVGSGRLAQQAAELEKEIAELRAIAARHQRAGQIDREATQAIQTQLGVLRGERADLAREAARLRGLVADGDGTFEIGDYSLRRLDGGNQYAYAFTISRKIEGARRVEGELMIRVAGRMKGESVELPLADLSADQQTVHRLGFKQFQTIEGRLQIPTGFAPSEMIIDVNPKGPSFKPFVNTFDWAWTEG